MRSAAEERVGSWQGGGGGGGRGGSGVWFGGVWWRASSVCGLVDAAPAVGFAAARSARHPSTRVCWGPPALQRGPSRPEVRLWRGVESATRQGALAALLTLRAALQAAAATHQPLACLTVGL
jgi:hypothetical protein